MRAPLIKRTGKESASSSKGKTKQKVINMASGNEGDNINDSDNLPIHQAVFNDDVRKLSQLLRKHDVGAKDKHGL